jgi:L-threonylcarbamoyladenylate synthase
MNYKPATERLKADAKGVAYAAQILSAGGLVAVPTETVYGLAARADDAEAVARIYAAKGRPDFNPLIVHIGDWEQAHALAQWNDAALTLAKEHWPGPLTCVLPIADDAKLAPSVTAGLPTVAVRMPAHPAMRALLEACDFPLAAPSANKSGFISPTSADHVLASLDGRIDLVLDAGDCEGGACEAGLESTILGFGEDGSVKELRAGPIDWEGAANEPLASAPTTSPITAPITAPGQLASHYSPGKPVRLNAEMAEADEFMIGFGSIKGDCTLSASGDVKEAAAALYACLHLGADSQHSRIAVAPILDEGPQSSLGRAINDRLRRAATPADAG